jgi:imidazole glycerol-phosphate synthase subunit HisH
MIVIVDYNIGNIGSIVNMLKRIGTQAVVSSQPEVILKADKLILPGVGAFDNGMKKLRSSGLIDVLEQKVFVEKTCILGICLGAQLMTQCSEEGQEPGLGWVKSRTIRFFSQQKLTGYRVPHMGWNEVTQSKKSPLFHHVPEDARFYFLHSYHFDFKETEDELAVTNYGYRFTSAFEVDNFFGVQFHPEKSHKFGMALLQSFADKVVSPYINECGEVL